MLHQVIGEVAMFKMAGSSSMESEDMIRDA